MTDHTHIDARLRDNLDDILYPMKAVSIEHYNTAMEMADALINDAVREARHEERSWTVRNLQSNTPQTMLTLASERLKNIALSKDKEK